jgi:hypothetical protein
MHEMIDLQLTAPATARGSQSPMGFPRRGRVRWIRN